MDKATYTLLLDFGSGWEDFTEKIVLQEGYVPRSCIGREGKHEIQTVALKIHKGAGLSARLVQAENDIPAKLLRNGIVVLRGIVRPYTTSRAVLNRMDPVTLSILDMSATLEQYVFDTQYWTNLVLINRADVSASLIHKLFAEAGVEASDVLVDFDRIEQIPHYALSNGEYLSDRIQEALYEYGLTYRATSDGKFRILDISPDAITPAETIGTAQLRTEFSLSRNDSSQKGAIVKWYPVLSKADAELFLADEDGQTIASGAVYPNGADADGYRLPYDISEYAGTGKLLSIENPRIEYTPTSLSVDVHAEFGQDDCSAYLQSTSTRDQTITRFAIIADIRYKGSTASQQVVQGTKPKTYTAKVISDAGSALRLARILASRQTVGKQAYGFDSPVQFQPGTIVRVIEDKVSHMDVTVRITSCEYSVSTGLYAYVGEGVADIDLTTTVERIDAIENALGKPRKGRDGAKGDTGATGPQGLQGLQGAKGDQGVQGPIGSDGLAAYNHIAYADSAAGSGFSQSPTGKTYIGFYSDHTATDSTDASKYQWSLIKGANGAQGIQGPTGADGQTSFFHTAWANSANGATGFSTTVSTGKLYIGVYSDHTAANSTNYASYSWTLIKGDKGDTGASAKDFSIFTSPATYALSSRGKCLAVQTVTLLCNKLNIATSVAMGWTHSNGISLSSASGSPVTVTIPAGSTLASFSVTCTVTGYGTKTVTILGVKSGEAKPMYLGIQTSAPGQTSEGPLFGNSQDGGDFYLDTENIPHWYNGTSWNPVDKATPNYSQIMGTILGDVFNSNTTIPVSSAVYGFFKSLAANDAFLKYLQSLNLLVGNGNGTDESGFRFRARSFDSAGNYDPLFDIFNGSKQLFKVDVSSGKIYFGQYFWYDPSDGIIHTPNDRLLLNANGQIDGDAIQVISTLNAGFLQPWEGARFPNTSAYILDFINETPLQMANKLDVLFTTYASHVKSSFSPDPDLIADGRNGMILFSCVSGNNSTMQLYNSSLGIVDLGMAHYIERYAVSGGFRYEIGTVTKLPNDGFSTIKVLYNNFLSYIGTSDTWTFPIDPFRDFTIIRILGITSYTDVIGGFNVHGPLNVSGPLSAAGVNTGHGIQELYPNLYEFHNVTSTRYISSMIVGETRFVYATVPRVTSYYLRLPSGGTYMVFGSWQSDDDGWGYSSTPNLVQSAPMAGGSKITMTDLSRISRYIFFIRRLS